jgi:hypothetical protein
MTQSALFVKRHAFGKAKRGSMPDLASNPLRKPTQGRYKGVMKPKQVVH